jgi:DNA-binding Lrp family transcriptional regulator
MSADAQRARLERARLEYLTEVYNLSQGNTRRFLSKFEIGNRLGISPEEVYNIVQYFKAEGLLEEPDIMARSRAAGETVRISITHKGIKEIEQALKHPDKPTKYFSRPSVILNISGGTFTNSPFQVASRNSTQNLKIAANNLAEIKQLVTELKEIQNNPNLPREIKEELEANTRILHLQSQAERPTKERIKATLSSIKSILEESSGVVTTATTLVTKIGSLLTGMG